MGSNRRYAHRIDERMDQRILEQTAKGGALQSLTRSELELDSEPFTRAPQPRPVHAWVRFGEVPIMVDAEACSWTAYAVAIRFTVAGTEYKTWVWSSAIREPRPRTRATNSSEL